MVSAIAIERELTNLHPHVEREEAVKYRRVAVPAELEAEPAPTESNSSAIIAEMARSRGSL